MGTFSEFLEKNKITKEMLVRASARVEAAGKEGRTLLKGRATKRRTEAQKSYADASIAKPPSGRGIGPEHIQTALSDQSVPRKVRAKLVRAVAAAKKDVQVDHKALFGEVTVKKGKKVEKKAAA